MTKDKIRAIALMIIDEPQAALTRSAVIALAEDWLDSNPVREEFPDTLTERQRQIATYIRDCILNRYPPTIREIMTKFDLNSPNGIMCHIKALIKKGVIVESEGGRRSRGIVLNSRYC